MRRSGIFTLLLPLKHAPHISRLMHDVPLKFEQIIACAVVHERAGNALGETYFRAEGVGQRVRAVTYFVGGRAGYVFGRSIFYKQKSKLTLPRHFSQQIPVS